MIVVGPPGSGKTTLATTLAERLGLPYVEMDALWWEANWTEVGEDRLREKLEPIAETDRWVVDGNYFTVGSRAIVWPRADTIVWLDPPKWLAVSRVIRRTVRRSLTRTELWAGNREHLRTVLGPNELLRFLWREFPKYRNRYSTVADDPQLAHLTVVHLERARDVRRWLMSIGC